MTERTRSKGGFTNLPLPHFMSPCGEAYPANPYATGTITDANGVFETMSDRITSSFSKLSAKGAVIVNPMTKVKTQRTNTHTGAEWQCKCSASPLKYTKFKVDGPRLTQLAGKVRVSSLISDEAISSVRSEVSTEVHAAAGSGDAQLIVDIVEYKQLGRMLGKPLANLKGFLDNVSRSKSFHRSGLTLAQFLSSEWLRYRYGIMPLVGSITGSVKAWEKSQVVRPVRSTARATRQLYATETTSHLNVASEHNITYSVEATDQVVVRGGLIYEDYRTLQSDLGFSLREIPATMWDLIPYSFVADHFINMGDYLRALGMMAGRRDLGSWTVVKRTQSATRSVTSAVWANKCEGSSLKAPGGNESVWVETTTRSSGMAGPALQLKTSLVPIWLQNYRTLDYLSLLISRVAGRR